MAVDSYLVEASKVVPVFERVKPNEKAPKGRFESGCFGCGHTSTLGLTRFYSTITVDDHDEAFMFGIVLATGDTGLADMMARRPNYWLSRVLLNRIPHEWYDLNDVDRDDIDQQIYVRKYNFGDEIVHTPARRVDFKPAFEDFHRRLRAEGQRGGEVRVSMLTSPLRGMYVEPVPQLRTWPQWGNEEIYRHVRFARGMNPRDINMSLQNMFPRFEQATASNLVRVSPKTKTKEPLPTIGLLGAGRIRLDTATTNREEQLFNMLRTTAGRITREG